MSKQRIGVIALAALATTLAFKGVWKAVQLVRPLTLSAVAPRGTVSTLERALRPVYPYSVIPGGAYTPAELRNSIAKDKVVQAHYSDFDVSSARAVTLEADRFQYVSYRLNNKVYWTSRKLRIPKGEVLLTDGKHFARTRCGNRLCDTRQTPTTFPPPSYRSLSLPPFTPKLLAKGQVTLAPAPALAELLSEPLQPGFDFGLPGVAPFVGPAPPMPGSTPEALPPIGVLSPPLMLSGGVPILPSTPSVPSTPLIPSTPSIPIGPIGPAPPPPVIADVPEPASLYLFVAAFAVSLWFITRWMRDHEQSSESKEDESQSQP